MPPIYVDLDYTLEYPVYRKNQEFDHFVFRPWAQEFLSSLSEYGDITILTASEGGWAEDALSERQDLRRLVSRIITLEDMQGIIAQVDGIFRMEMPESEKLELAGQIEPIAEPGVIFDDYAYGTDIYFAKSISVGTFLMGASLWIQVERFTEKSKDDEGLDQAFQEFVRRNDRWTRGGFPGIGIPRGLGANFSSKDMERTPLRGYTFSEKPESLSVRRES